MNLGMDDILEIVKADISDPEILQSKGINAIVNAAKSTLMGSTQGVDGALHNKIPDLNDRILNELGGDREHNRMRCPRGKAAVTSGGNLCRYIIHVVGPQYDGRTGTWMDDCSSSRISTLEACYFAIVNEIRMRPDIQNVAVPVISSGDYGFPFKTAVEVAVAALCNAILEWRIQEPESFEMSELKKVYLFIYHQTAERKEDYFQCAQQTLQKYRPILKRNRRVVYQSSFVAHLRYWKEIREYDENRGYFFCAKKVRELLMLIRMVFMPWMLLKDIFGGRDWVRRRQFVELFTIGKMLIPCLILMFQLQNSGLWLVPGLIVYNMCDTLTYLLVLIVMSDVQRASANIIRSIMMLFINYMEVSLDMAVLYCWHGGNGIDAMEAVCAGLVGYQNEVVMAEGGMKYAFLLADHGIKFFFITMVFGYFSSHMRLRKFKS